MLHQPGQPPDRGRRVSAERAADGGRLDGRLQRLLWLIVCCLVLAALAFVDRPGNIIADTKLDLAVNPVGFLQRALHLWDPSQFGQLQDQAVGYLFPIGPFFVAGKLMALDPWVVQRLWITAVAVAAFLGVLRLSARLGIGTPATQLAAGFAYALAPRGLTLLGVLSGEFLPAAMLPWIVLPLVQAVQEGGTMGTAGRIRVAARSAVAVAFCSGNNAASVVAMLTGASIYLITAPRSARAWRIFAWWAPAVVLATVWWLYPLVLLGRYGVSFIPYTESAAVTTSVTSLSNTLRGTEDWVSYLVVNGNPWWPVGFTLSTGIVPTILTGLIAGLGIAGLLRRGLPARRYLLCVLLAGVLIILTGYVSGLGNPLAGPLDHLLNGPLAPLRNLRKFDPLIRLPVALGLAHLLASIRLPSMRKAVSALAACAVAVLILPAFMTGLSTPGGFPAIPQYWLRAAGWLNRHAANQAVLAVPGARFGEYLWGRPMDDVLEALFKGTWASRQLNGIGSVGNARLLVAIDQRMAAGQGSAGLTQILARMGIAYIVVRNDLVRTDLRGAWPARIHQAIRESPGIVRVAQFGSVPVGSVFPDDAVSAFDTPYPPVEIYRVNGAQPTVTVQPAASTIRVYGGPEALLTMADQGLLRNRPMLLNSDSTNLPVSQSFVTDSLRRRIRNFGELRVDYSPTLTATDPAQTFAAADDFIEPAWRRYRSVAQYYGIKDVTASSSDADIGAINSQSSTGRLPYAAVDGDLRTMWESGSLTGPIGQWITISFDQPVDPGIIGLALANDPVIGPPVTWVTISTSVGAVIEPVRQYGGFQAVRVPAGRTSWLRITIAATKWRAPPGGQVGIAEISVPGVAASRTIVAPDASLANGGDPAAFVLSKAEPMQPGCMLTSLRWVCSPLLAKPTEEQYGFDHSFIAARAQPIRLTGSAILTDVGLIERYGRIGSSQLHVSSSSAYTSDPQDQAQSAFDGDPATTWVAGATDTKPRLSVRWARPRVISELTISRPPGASDPLLIQVTGSRGQTRSGWLVRPTARLRFVPMRTDSVALTFAPSTLPLQISDITIPGVRPLTSAGALPFRLRCGLGPRVQLNGTTIPTRASGTFGALLAGRPLHFSACRRATVMAGRNRVIEPSWDAFDIQAVVLAQTRLTAPRVALTAIRAGSKEFRGASTTSPETVSMIRWGSAVRVVRVQADQPSYLVVDQNFNAGWQATIAGRVLHPVRLDGWRQGWVLPSGATGLVTLTYLPDSGYRRSVIGGLGALGTLMLVAIVPARARRRTARVPARAAESSASAPRGAHAPPRWPRFTGRRAARLPGAVLLAVFGLWVAGYPGALILPLAVGAFATAMHFRRVLILVLFTSPWLVPVLLLTVSALGAAGQHLALTGRAGPIVRVLSDTAPQVLCLIIVARIVTGLVMPEPGPQHEPAPQAVSDDPSTLSRSSRGK